jgi:uncharacterized peroxidase-related enzyme
MTLLKITTPDQATGDLALLYERVKKGFGSVSSAFRSLSASPELLKQHLDFIGFYIRHEHLSAPLLACIRMLVSEQTHCDYCIGMNAGMLVNMMGWTPEQVAATRADPAAANLPEREKELLMFVLDTVRDPQAVTASQLDTLRAQGWTDADILDATNHGARMVANDILLNAFKVERDY